MNTLPLSPHAAGDEPVHAAVPPADLWARLAAHPHLLAVAVGALSAFAFQPAALWPLMPLAFVALLALLERPPRLRSALATGWAFGFGQFAVGLNWIATAFTFQTAM